jgi:carboxylesterase
VGVLLIHGFTGSPPEMRMVGKYLHERGFTVSGPLLPGHGTVVEDMNACRWSDWTDHVEQALVALRTRCAHVFVGGLSMGALLSLYLAAHHPELSGAIAYSPPVKVSNRLIYLTPILKHVIRKKLKSADTEQDLTDPNRTSPTPRLTSASGATRRNPRLADTSCSS